MYIKYKNSSLVNVGKAYDIDKYKRTKLGCAIYTIEFAGDFSGSAEWEFEAESERDYVYDYITTKLVTVIPDFKE